MLFGSSVEPDFVYLTEGSDKTQAQINIANPTPE